MWSAAPGKAGVCLRGQLTTTRAQPFNSDKSANKEVSKGRRKEERETQRKDSAWGTTPSGLALAGAQCIPAKRDSGFWPVTKLLAPAPKDQASKNAEGCRRFSAETGATQLAAGDS